VDAQSNSPEIYIHYIIVFVTQEHIYIVSQVTRSHSKQSSSHSAARCCRSEV